MPDQTPDPLRAFATFGVVGFQIAIWIVMGLWVGRWLDSVIGTSPIFMIIGLLGGVAFGILGMILLIKRYLGDRS